MPLQKNASISHLLFTFLLSFALLSSSCATFRVQGKGDPISPISEKRTVWAFGWGLIQPRDVRPLCESGALDEVVIKTNFGYILLSSITLGLVIPLKLECKCSKEHIPREGIGSNF